MLKNSFSFLAQLWAKSVSNSLSVLVLFVSIGSFAQTDSTDLDLYMSDAVLETELDTILYSGESFELLNLDFTVSDTVAFSKVHIELKNTTGNYTVFKKMYTLSELETQALITSWDVSIPFGNLENTNSYLVAIIVEEYDGSLGSTITKTLLP